MTPAPLSPATGFDPARLIESHQAGVWRYLRALGCDSTLAEDLTQDTFLAVLKRPFCEVNEAATTAYLRKTALNMLISYERRRGKVRPVEDIEILDQAWMRWAGDEDGEILVEHLRECMKRLTGRARTALTMRFAGDHSRSEIAQALEISEHGAKNLMQRAKQQLRDCIESKLSIESKQSAESKLK